MSITGQWLWLGTFGTASLAVAAAALPPPPFETRPAVVARAAEPAAATPVADGCGREAWPLVSPGCAGRPANAVRVIQVSALGAGPALGSGPARVAAPAARAAAPSQLADARAQPAKAARAARRHDAGRTREARRAPVVRVSLCQTGACAQPRQAAAPAVAQVTVGPRVDR